jgi:hypothetical protein
MEILAVLTGVASIVLAVVAIWLALHHKQETDRTNEAVRDLLTEVRSDAKTIAGVVLPELQKYGEAARRSIFFEKVKEPAPEVAGTPVADVVTTTKDASATLEQFYRIVETIRDGTRFSSKQRDEAMALARKLRSESDFAGDEEFAIRLEELIDSFAAGDQYLHVNALADLFHSVASSTPGIIHTLVTSSGYRILEVPNPGPKLIERFDEYAKLAQQNALDEIAMSFGLVHASRSGDSSKVQQLLEEMRAWDSLRSQQVVEAIQRRTDANNIARTVTDKIEAVAQAHREFWEKYGDQLREFGEA